MNSNCGAACNCLLRVFALTMGVDPEILVETIGFRGARDEEEWEAGVDGYVTEDFVLAGLKLGFAVVRIAPSVTYGNDKRHAYREFDFSSRPVINIARDHAWLDGDKPGAYPPFERCIVLPISFCLSFCL